MEVYITGMDRGCLSSREPPILHWNGQMEMTGLAASHTLRREAFHGPPLLWKIALLFKMDRWMSLQQGTSHTSMKWTDGDNWAGSFPYFRKYRLPCFSSGMDEGGLMPEKPLTTTRREREHLKID